MAWRRQEGRTSRLLAVARAARSLPVRRALAIGGLTLTAWALGSAAPALADTFDTVTETARLRDGQAVEQHNVEFTAITETVTPPVDPDTTSVPAVESPQIIDVDPLLDLATTETDALPVPPVESAPGVSETARTSDEDTDSPAFHDDSATGAATGAAKHDADPAPHEPERSSAVEATPDTDDSASEPSVSAAPAPTQPAQAQQQGPSSSGALAGYLTYPPAAPRRDALTSTVGHSTALPPQQHVADPFFSPD
ncbi:hypothetical protein NI17_019020 [Thermobifida halotolerans]|uniref:Uncharacterized protein n=1 Tax=Thermobifida halotolerans TaxID=483545 RepID=A0A399FUH3_9ACTN|nr:hypothetical protein [Thermobifida halotolerans]UOE18845.1 hypothetical protein NI17_019020 [Thermobifida halotolerans]